MPTVQHYTILRRTSATAFAQTHTISYSSTRPIISWPRQFPVVLRCAISHQPSSRWSSAQRQPSFRARNNLFYSELSNSRMARTLRLAACWGMTSDGSKNFLLVVIFRRESSLLRHIKCLFLSRQRHCSSSCFKASCLFRPRP